MSDNKTSAYFMLNMHNVICKQKTFNNPIKAYFSNKNTNNTKRVFLSQNSVLNGVPIHHSKPN